tara:strand:+ start:2225 stop:2977 length:753 start_codon:yes stop_codon:yes gene_type:complete
VLLFLLLFNCFGTSSLDVSRQQSRNSQIVSQIQSTIEENLLYDSDYYTGYFDQDEIFEELQEQIRSFIKSGGNPNLKIKLFEIELPIAAMILVPFLGSVKESDIELIKQYNFNINDKVLIYPNMGFLLEVHDVEKLRVFKSLGLDVKAKDIVGNTLLQNTCLNYINDSTFLEFLSELMSDVDDKASYLMNKNFYNQTILHILVSVYRTSNNLDSFIDEIFSYLTPAEIEEIKAIKDEDGRNAEQIMNHYL